MLQVTRASHYAKRGTGILEKGTVNQSLQGAL